MEPKIVAWLKDALYNAHSSNIFNDECATYARGIVVGVTSAVMSYSGKEFDEAWDYVQSLHQIDPRCIPKGWPRRTPTETT